MIDVSEGEQQGDAHLLEFPSGKRFLVDTGFSGQPLIRFLKKNNISSIDDVLITHAHRDHYGGLLPLLNAGFKVSHVHMNPIDSSICEREKPWGCQPPEVSQLFEQLKKMAVPAERISEGKSYFQQGSIDLKVVAAFDGIHTPIGKTDCNDTSAILKLRNGSTVALFTGDLNSRMGEYLTKFRAGDLKSDLLKVPHHGADSLPTDEFFDAVSAKLALVPAPISLWSGPRAVQVRNYVTKRVVPYFVSGLDGDVRVEIYSNRFEAHAGKKQFRGNTNTHSERRLH